MALSRRWRQRIAAAARQARGDGLRGALAVIRAAFGGADAAAPAVTPDVAPDVVPGADVRITTPEVRVPAPAPTPAPAPPGAPTADGDFIAGSHSGEHGSRDYKLFIPPQAGGRALPLVVMLHGCTQDPDDFATGTGMNEAAAAEGFFVLYPAQSAQAHPQRCWNWFSSKHQQRDQGEPALLAAMTREVMARHGIDPSRVYVAGLSAGGAMAAILGHTHPDLFAAVGVHSGLAAGAATGMVAAFGAMRSGGSGVNSPQMPPTIVFHGDQDSTVNPVNGEQVVAALTRATQVHSETVPGRDGHACTRQVMRDASGALVAEHWVVHGAGHAWSGGREAGSFTDPRGPDATAAMLAFFRRFSRAAAS
jgi:poly(hydroxyalkanoate) depolymerase family esterase